MARNESLLVEVGAVEENARLNSPNLLFAPLNRTIRGRFSFHAAGPMAAREMIRWPAGDIPGQQIEIDSESGTGAIIETLYEETHAKFRKHIEQRGMVLPPEREEFKGIDSSAWLYWLRRACQAGLARIIRGKFPEKIAKPKSAMPADSLDKENQDLRTQLAIMQGQMNEMRAMLAKR